MAKLAVATAAILLLFAFSHALTPSDLPAKEIDARDLADSNPFSAGLRLPSERPGSKSESETVIEKEFLPADSKIPETDGPTIVANEESTEFQRSETVPLTLISFRPVNRHFPRRPFPFRHRRPCHHGHRQFGGDRVRQGEAVSYGDDMILASGNELGFDPAFPGDGVRQIPAKWAEIRHGGPRLPFADDDEMDLDRPHHHHHHHHHHHDHREEFEGFEKPREHEHDHHHEHEGGLMRKLRKFLNHF